MALAVTMTTVASQPALAGPGVGEVGSPAADWTLKEYLGENHTLSDYRGKVVFMFVVGYG
jgi:hypothetical protein